MAGPVRRPATGEPVVPYVSNTTLWNAIFDMIAAWRRGDFTRDRGNDQEMNAPAGENEGTTTMLGRTVRAIYTFKQPSSSEQSVVDLYLAQPVGKLWTPVWPDDIGFSSLMAGNVLPGAVRPFKTQRYIPVEIDNFSDVGDYVMFDPLDMTKMKRSTSGAYKIAAEYPAEDTVVVDTYESQPLWTYELTGAIVPAGTGSTAPATIKTLASQDYATSGEVISPFSVSIPATGYCVNVGRRFFALSDENSVLPSLGRIMFQTNAKINNREVAGEVTWVGGRPINVVGDTVQLHDPKNLFSDIEADATGMAVYQVARSGAITHDARWEIESCSLPINEIRAKISGCLKKTDADGTAACGVDPVDWIRSNYPNVDFPPELGSREAADHEFTFLNRWQLDAGLDAYGIFRRITNAKISEPENQTSPKVRSSTSVAWELIQVEEKKARHVRAVTAVSGSGVRSWTIEAFYDGADPELCGAVEFECELDCSCLQSDDVVYAFYKPETDKYIIYSSQSAVLGTPITTDVVVGEFTADGCGFAYATQSAKLFTCGESAIPQAFTPATIPVSVVTNVVDDGAQILVYRGTLHVCDSVAGATTAIDSTDCPTPCTGSCTWTWTITGSTSGFWTVTTPCAEGCDCGTAPADPDPYPAPEEVITTTTPCAETV